VPRLQEAVTQCMVIIPLAATGQQVPVLTWVCWSHIQGLQVKDGLIMPASASQMPTGPVPLLGR
jgi:hypothetical protein